MFRKSSVSVTTATHTPSPIPTGLNQRTLPEDETGTRPVPSEPGSRPVGLPAWVEAHSSETAEKATEEKQEGAQNQQPRATQSQLLLGVGTGRGGGMMEREGTVENLPLGRYLRYPQPKGYREKPPWGRGLSTSREQLKLGKFYSYFHAS